MAINVQKDEGWREVRRLALKMVAKTNPKKAEIIEKYDNLNDLEYHLFCLALEQGKMDEYKAINPPDLPDGLDIYNDAVYNSKKYNKPIDSFILEDYKNNMLPVINERERIINENRKTRETLRLAGSCLEAKTDKISEILKCLYTFNIRNTGEV